MDELFSFDPLGVARLHGIREMVERLGHMSIILLLPDFVHLFLSLDPVSLLVFHSVDYLETSFEQEDKQ